MILLGYWLSNTEIEFSNGGNMKRNFKIIAFDADDTLWVNEPYFQEAEKGFCELLSDFGTEDSLSSELFKTEMKNLEVYGYGAKSFMLSMIETAMSVGKSEVPLETVSKIIELGKDLLNKPVVLLEGVEEILESLTKKGQKLIVATKGDLLDQERKLERSNISKYFHHVEVMSNKKEADYLKLIGNLDVLPEDFLMIGNSMKSDILPVLNIGGYGVHVPFHTTWQHEKTEGPEHHDNLLKVDTISRIGEVLKL